MPARPLFRCGKSCKHFQLESSTPCECLILHECLFHHGGTESTELISFPYLCVLCASVVNLLCHSADTSRLCGFALQLWHGEVVNGKKARATGRMRRRVATLQIRMRHRSLGTTLRQRRSSRRHRLEGLLPVGVGGVQSLARRFSGRCQQTVPVETRGRSGQPTLLHGAFRDDCTRGITGVLGAAGVQRPGSHDGGETGSAELAHHGWTDEGDEPAVGKPAPSGGAHRTANHYRFSEVEKSHGRVQRRPAAGRHRAERTGAEHLSRLACCPSPGLLAKITAMISPDLLEILACPVCRKPLVMRGEDALKCNECKRVYPIRNGIPILLEPEATIEEL